VSKADLKIIGTWMDKQCKRMVAVICVRQILVNDGS